MEERIRSLLSRLEQVEFLLGESDVLSDQKQFRSLAQEQAYLSELRDTWNECESLHKRRLENQELLKMEKDPEFDSYVERFEKGNEAQKKALAHFYEILDKYIWDVSPIGRGLERETVLLHPHHKMGMYKHMIENLLSRIYRIPTRHLESVMWKLIETAVEAEKNNWYEKTPEK